jgi:rhamnogalacturonan endolyase
MKTPVHKNEVTIKRRNYMEITMNIVKNKMLKIILAVIFTGVIESLAEVELHDEGGAVILTNDLVTLEFRKDAARIVSMKVGDDEELLSSHRMMHLDSFFRLLPDRRKSHLKGPSLTAFRVLRQEPDLVEVSFLWENFEDFPFRADIRYIMRSGQSGFYMYLLFGHGNQSPAAMLEQLRLVGFFNPDVFTHQAINGDRRARMPSAKELNDGIELDPREAVLLPSGRVYCKYDWVEYVEDLKLSGLYGKNKGIWIVTPTNEWNLGGPTKQHLTGHPTSEPFNAPALSLHFHTRHFVNPEESMLEFSAGVEWEKFYGPIFIYLNKDKEDLVDDAMKVAMDEIEKWPYEWIVDPSAVSSSRVAVKGNLVISSVNQPLGTRIILAEPSDSPSEWQNQGKDYIYWTETDKDGNFVFDNVRPGAYTLYAYRDGVFGTYRKDGLNLAAQQKTIDIGNLEWDPAEWGKHIWQIGIPNRSAAEFKNGDFPRSWEKAHSYFLDFPTGVSFSVGESDYAEDWHYYHPAGYKNETGKIEPMVWNINFDLAADHLKSSDEGKLTIALAGAQYSRLHVMLNGTQIAHIVPPNDFHFQFGQSQGIYSLYEIDFDAKLLEQGSNQIHLEQYGSTKYSHIMYDSLKLEINETDATTGQ